jgi:hypothetical protein
MSNKIEVNEERRQYYWTNGEGVVIRRSPVFHDVTTVWISNTSHTVEHKHGTTVVTQANTAFIDFKGEVVK